MSKNNIEYEQILALNDADFIKKMLEYYEVLPKIIFKKVYVKSVKEFTFDSIKQRIRIEIRGEDFYLKYPIYDERRKDVYKSNPKRFPVNMLFELIDADLFTYPFGLVEVIIDGKHVTRKKTEFKYEDIPSAWKKPVTENFVFDYDNKVYIKVDITRKEEEILDLDEKYWLVQYKSRLEFREQVERRMKIIGETYYSAYDNVIAAISQNTSEDLPEQHDRILKAVNDFLNDYLAMGIICRLASKTVSLEEFKFLLNYKDEQIEKIKNNRKFLIKFNQKESLKNQITIKKELTKEYKEFVDLRNSIKEIMFKERKEDGTSQNPYDGFLFYDQENDVLYPTIAEIERRNALYEDSSSPTKEKSLLEKLKKRMIKWDKEEKQKQIEAAKEEQKKQTEEETKKQEEWLILKEKLNKLKPEIIEHQKIVVKKCLSDVQIEKLFATKMETDRFKLLLEYLEGKIDGGSKGKKMMFSRNIAINIMGFSDLKK